MIRIPLDQPINVGDPPCIVITPGIRAAILAPVWERIAALEKHCNACLSITQGVVTGMSQSAARDMLMKLTPLNAAESIPGMPACAQPAAPDADEAAVEALCAIRFPLGKDATTAGPLNMFCEVESARAILAAIRRGDVPGIRAWSFDQLTLETERDILRGVVDRMGHEMRAARAELEQLKRDGDGMGYWEAEATRLRAELEQAKRELDEARMEGTAAGCICAINNMRADRDRTIAERDAARRDAEAARAALHCERLSVQTWHADAEQAHSDLAAAVGLLRPMANGLRQFAANGIHEDPAHSAWRIQAEHFAAQADAFLAKQEAGK